jgi:hypothetical protein
MVFLYSDYTVQLNKDRVFFILLDIVQLALLISSAIIAFAIVSLTITTGTVECFNRYLNIPAPEYACLYFVLFLEPTISIEGWYILSYYYLVSVFIFC